MTIHTVTVLGLGVLGSQIAFQAALHGFQVTGYDLSDDALAGARATLDRLAPRIQVDLGLGDDAMAQARARLGLTTDLAQAVGGADLVIELVPEDPAIKRDLYARIAPLAPEGAIFATNSSTLLPSALADATGRPARFLALHFANEIWAHRSRKSWAIRAPTRRSMTASWPLPAPSAWCRSRSQRNSPAMSSTACWCRS